MSKCTTGAFRCYSNAGPAQWIVTNEPAGCPTSNRDGHRSATPSSIESMGIRLHGASQNGVWRHNIFFRFFSSVPIELERLINDNNMMIMNILRVSCCSITSVKHHQSAGRENENDRSRRAVACDRKDDAAQQQTLSNFLPMLKTAETVDLAHAAITQRKKERN